MDEVISPTITIKVVGFFFNGPKSYILNKIKDTNFKFRLVKKILYRITFYLNSLKNFNLNTKNNITNSNVLSTYNLLLNNQNKTFYSNSNSCHLNFTSKNYN